MSVEEMIERLIEYVADYYRTNWSAPATADILAKVDELGFKLVPKEDDE